MKPDFECKILQLMQGHLPSISLPYLIRTRWKDGIDIDEPGHEIMAFVHNVMEADRQAADDANAADLARQEQNHTCQLPTTRQALAALEKQQRAERLYRKVHNL